MFTHLWHVPRTPWVANIDSTPGVTNNTDCLNRGDQCTDVSASDPPGVCLGQQPPATDGPGAAALC